MRIYKQIRQYDRQLVLHFDPGRGRWVLLRMPEKYGTPAVEYTDAEIQRRVSAGNLMEILVCQNDEGHPMSPSGWLLNYLREKDTRRINFRQYVREMDERNQKRSEELDEEHRDRIDYQSKENWNHLRDELRGELGFRKYTIQIEKPDVHPTNPS